MWTFHLSYFLMREKLFYDELTLSIDLSTNF
jgi:hypothetical protein